jgi:predicted nucleic acid-binding protein
MTEPRGYLLDTNIVLFATREGSELSRTVDRQFQLSASRFRPAICEVSIAELKAFALAWGEGRRQKLKRVIESMLVVQISEPRIHDRWAGVYSYARSKGLAIQQDHNDIWIAAASNITGLRLLSTDRAAFLPLRGTGWVDVVVLDVTTGLPVP